VLNKAILQTAKQVARELHCIFAASIYFQGQKPLMVCSLSAGVSDLNLIDQFTIVSPQSHRSLQQFFFHNQLRPAFGLYPSPCQLRWYGPWQQPNGS
jgi:hypothetical protein